MESLVGSDQSCALSFLVDFVSEKRIGNVAAKGAKISLDLNFARILDSVG